MILKRGGGESRTRGNPERLLKVIQAAYAATEKVSGLDIPSLVMPAKKLKGTAPQNIF